MVAYGLCTNRIQQTGDQVSGELAWKWADEKKVTGTAAGSEEEKKTCPDDVVKSNTATGLNNETPPPLGLEE